MPNSPDFDDAVLLGTLDSFPFAGVDSDLSDEERFARGVAQVLRAWLRAHQDETGSHAVFLLQASPPDELADLPRETFFALDDGETDVTSGMWFVGPPVIRGTRFETQASFDEMFPAVVSAGVGDVAAVTYRKTARGPMLRFYPHGLSDPERAMSMRLAESAVDLSKVFELVDIVHRSTLVTPSGHQGGAKLWKNREKHYPVRHVEVEIQAYLRTGLSVGLPLCRINPEQNLVAGRLDLEIEELDPTTRQVSRPAILELKVIRSFGSTGASTSNSQTEKWLSEGVDQAHAYREERSARAGALCCFDMRVNPTDEACFKKVESKASGLKVAVKSWPLYPDVKLFRAAGATTALSAGSPQATT
ncbi:hypothetical protein [Nocardioides jishulii]|uniref:Uncharacterized protein n=1 Tax=Nocardioides jishulii TaxID=2575440 RepID=A0A4U2YRR3_9ACTN|nr:hypothetical protein [Nocardioides jishulii]QCX26113.1 hypothetical protein FCL41_00065 [Nocardioides jishulii]TKI64088.1 hypothetical protein FC770_02645 [Nocardioides jishulii]